MKSFAPLLFLLGLLCATLAGAQPQAIPTSAQVQGLGNVQIGTLTATPNTGPDNRFIHGDFAFAAPYGYLDNWYNFRWVNVMIGHTVNGVNNDSNGDGNPDHPLLGELPAIDPAPLGRQNGNGDDDQPFYWTDAEFEREHQEKVSSHFEDGKRGGAGTVVLTFRTWLVAQSIGMDSKLPVKTFCIRAGFTWTSTGVDGGNMTKAITAMHPNPTAAHNEEVRDALGNAAFGGPGFPGWAPTRNCPLAGNCWAVCTDGSSGFRFAVDADACRQLCDDICGGRKDNVVSCFFENKVPVKTNRPVRDPNSAVISRRIFNDCPSSTITTGNSYPASIFIDDAVLDCFGFSNLHNWRFSTDGVSPMVFKNGDQFTFSADLVITGATHGEAGLLLSPWWSLNVDGRFNVRTSDGEIACFGGRLPFYSFTVSHGITYTRGNTIGLSIVYNPNGLSHVSPATIEYRVNYQANNYTSGELPFDQGNAAEDPPHGLWGILTPAGAGGHMQAFLQPGNPAARVRATWSNIRFFSNVSEKVPGVSPWAASLIALLMVGAGTIWVVRRRAEVA